MLSTYLFAALLPSFASATFVVPLPGGPYGISIQDVLLTDHSRPDPYLNLTYRRVPISVISQSGSSGECEPVLQSYMPNATAAFWEQAFTSQYGIPFLNTLTQTQLIVCQPKLLQSPTPVLLLGPGAGISRYFYNILGSMITAQTGYTVITYDIPGQTEIVAFPDGSVEYEAPAAEDPTFTNNEAIGNVTRDARIILDAIFFNSTGHNVTSDPPLATALKQTQQAAITGHSQGGAAALEALIADSRLSCGANLDGGLNSTAFPFLANTSSTQYTTTKPFAIFEHQGFNQTSVVSWPIVWSGVLRGSKWQFQLNGTQHDSYGDFAYLTDLYGIRQKANVSTTAIDSLMGVVPGSVVLEVVKVVMSSFLQVGFGQDPADTVAASGQQFVSWGFELVNQTIVPPRRQT